MSFNRQKFVEILSKYSELNLINSAEIDETLSLLNADHPFFSHLQVADSVHLHIKVDDVKALPRSQILSLGPTPESEQEGYVKFAHKEGINLIFSSIPVAVEDLIEKAPKFKKPFLDHTGIDMRLESASVKQLFDEVPARAKTLGWTCATQGGEGTPVYCCHTEVKGKHWAFPKKGRPIEFAFGALTLHGAKMGCDLRPIDPSSPFADQVPACAGKSGGPAHYYDPKDLGRFAEMGKFAAPLMEKFFDYYLAATSTDGALTRREKSLIGLAVAHSKQCPYCIEAYTGQCAETGATPEQMHEAVHVAAALAAGIDLVHGVQMQNALRAKHLIQ